MKNLLLTLGLLLTVNSSIAHMIIGTPVLEETFKTKIFVNSVESTCRVKIDKVKNLMIEDSYGNPGYLVWMDLHLNGNDSKRKIKISFKSSFELTNFFEVGNKVEARDFIYASKNGLTLETRRDGAVSKVTFPYGGRNITCLF